MRLLAQPGVARGAVILALWLVPSSLASQNPQPPQIKVSTRLVEFGVIVRDKDGPVEDMTKDDFVVLDRGKQQKISVFTVGSSESAPQPAQPLPPNTFSNLPQYGSNRPRSVTIILLDNLNTLSGSTPEIYESTPFWLEDRLANAKQHLIEFLKKLDRDDRIAIYGLTDSLHVLCDFTCDRDQLLAVVSKYDATSHTRREAVEPGKYYFPAQPSSDPRALNAHVDGDVQALAALNNQTRAQTTMAALVAIAAHVADIPGRKNLLWLTANLPFAGQAIARILGRANIAAYPVDARGFLPRSPSVSSETDATVRGQLGSLLGVNNDSSQADQPTGTDTMEKMAEDTGGRAFVNTNDLTGAIRKAVEDSAVTYRVGFYIDSASIDGKFHELKVEVKRRGVTVRYPKAYFAFEDTQVTKDENRHNLVAAVRSPIESSAIPLQVRVDRVDKPLPDCLSIFGSIDIHNLPSMQNGGLRKGTVDVVTVEQDPSGKVLAQAASTIALHFTDKQYADYLKSGFPFHQYVQPKANTATLRILVEDPATAEVGSVIIPVAQVN